MKKNTGIPNMEILSTKRQIRLAVRQVVSSAAKEKVIIVAFVGAGAHDYIEDGKQALPAGLRLYCWDKEGCTSPRVIQSLRKRGVKVFFAQGLHMKLYWAKGHDAVIGSANLSDNGLGDGGLHELAVRVPSAAVDIDQIIKAIHGSPVTSEMLTDLFNRTTDYKRRNKWRDFFGGGKAAGHAGKRKAAAKAQSFERWLQNGAEQKWKLFVYSECYSKTPLAVREAAGAPYDFWSGTHWYTTPSEWILSVNTESEDIDWMIADRQLPMEKNDKYYDVKDGETHYAIQERKSPIHDAPFDCTEKRFQTAILSFLRDEGIHSWAESIKFMKESKGYLNKSQLLKLKGFLSTKRTK